MYNNINHYLSHLSYGTFIRNCINAFKVYMWLLLPAHRNKVPFALGVHLMALLQEKMSEFCCKFQTHFSVLMPFNSFQLHGKEVVCSKHFLPECIKASLGGRKYLLKDAIPTEFEWTTPALKRKPPKKRLPLPKTPKKASQQAQASLEIESASSEICEEQDASV